MRELLGGRAIARAQHRPNKNDGLNHRGRFVVARLAIAAGCYGSWALLSGAEG